MEKFTVAFVGCGNFAKHFVSLMKEHPAVEKVYVCDLIRERAEEYSKDYDVEIIDTYEEILERKDIQAVANFTQRHLHGDIVIRALKAGKHVYSAVPMAPTVEECQEIVKLVKEKDLIYLMGETCYYYPCAMYCREAYKAGKFGDFTYGASQYYHHIDHISYGKRPNEGGMPPLLYPTHSTGMILSAVDSYVKKVACFGYVDKTNDGRFGVNDNEWHNTHSNQYVLMELANGGTARVTETEEEVIKLTDVSDYVNTKGMVENKNLPDFKEKVANGEWQWEDVAEVQAEEMARLPKEYENLDNGHMATHKFLIDDFCKAVYNHKQPVLNAWTAARFTIPGLVAIESANKGGIPIEVPDCGECPENL